TADAEPLVGQALATLGRPRDAYLVAGKVWFDRYPAQSMRDQVVESLRRLGCSHLDVVYVSGYGHPRHAADEPTAGSLDDAVLQVAALVDAGLARAWGVNDWSAESVDWLAAFLARHRLRPPALAEMPYNLVRRAAVENEALVGLCERHGTRVVAS